MKIDKQTNINIYNLNPNVCGFCKKPIPYNKRVNKFCNHSCAASVTSLGVIKNKDKPFNKNCLFCTTKISGKKFCNRICQIQYNEKIRFDKLLSNRYDTTYNHRIAKSYLSKTNDGKCQICGLSEWQGKPMPLVLDHISGNSSDGSLSNLRVICNNCDSLTDTYKYKNKGNGRAKRRQRFKEGKSY